MKKFCFTVDDNIRFLKELCEADAQSLFDHPYTEMLFRLHEKFNLKIQLNLFYRTEGFDLSEMTDRFANEWRENSGWLKLSFHSDCENVCPYESSDYEEVFEDCRAVNSEVMRFASSDSLARTTTVHYCQTTEEGVHAVADNGVMGLLGLFGNSENPHTSYSLGEKLAQRIRGGEIVSTDGMAYAAIDAVINNIEMKNIVPTLSAFLARDSIRVMIHEQYFYEDYKSYQPDFEEKLARVFSWMRDNGFESCFFEEII